MKIIRNKQTGFSEGYGFVEFVDRATAEHALKTLNGTPMPSAHQMFRLNWASFGVGGGASGAGGGANDHSVFVGDLPPEVNDYALQETFAERYPSVRNARVVTDPNTGRSKGFGFVRFGDESERDRALVEMNGVPCGSRVMRISLAIPRKGADSLGGMPSRGSNQDLTNPAPANPEPENSTVFVGGLDPTLAEPDLRTHFEAFGELVYVKIPAGKGCGFVQFTQRTDAEASIQALNGQMMGASRVRLSWVRSGGGAGRNMGPAGAMGSPYGMPYGGYPPYAMAGAYGVDPSWAAAQAQYAAAAQYASMQAAYYGGAAAGMAHGAPPPPPMPVSMPGTPGGPVPPGAIPTPGSGSSGGNGSGSPTSAGGVAAANAAYVAQHERGMMGGGDSLSHRRVSSGVRGESSPDWHGRRRPQNLLARAAWIVERPREGHRRKEPRGARVQRRV